MVATLASLNAVFKARIHLKKVPELSHRASLALPCMSREEFQSIEDMLDLIDNQEVANLVNKHSCWLPPLASLHNGHWELDKPQSNSTNPILPTYTSQLTYDLKNLGAQITRSRL